MRIVGRTALLAVVLVVGAAAPALAIPEGPEDGTPEWGAREAANFARTRDEANRELTDPAFQARLTEQSALNAAAYATFQAANQFQNQGNLCNHWMFTCAGDPFRYPGADPFYDEVGSFTEVLFFDRECARISGRVWAPLDAQPGDDRPAVVITNGSVQAPEPLYWWAAQALVEAGYVVMTWDPRGQGRSDTATPDGQQGSNANPTVFWDGTVDAVDFFRSSEASPYPHNATCAAVVDPLRALANATPHNPHAALVDPERLGLAGHSLGATGVATVQAMDPWEGQLDTTNPVDVIVAWDSLPGGFTPRVPAMGQSSEYGLFNFPFTSSPDPEAHKGGYAAWVAAEVPVAQFTIQGSTHYEWSQIPTTPVVNFSSTDWTNWGNPMAAHYTVAWFDRWLKHPDEPGHDTADARLLADDDFCERLSFYFRSARHFPTRDGAAQRNEDIRASCLAGATPPAPTPTTGPAPAATDTPAPAPASTAMPTTAAPATDPMPTTGGGVAVAVVLLALSSLGRRARRRT